MNRFFVTAAFLLSLSGSVFCSENSKTNTENKKKILKNYKKNVQQKSFEKLCEEMLEEGREFCVCTKKFIKIFKNKSFMTEESSSRWFDF